MNFLKLALLNLKLTLLRILQQLRITPLYFQKPLLRVDWEYFKIYSRLNPYRVCSDYFKNEPESKRYSYGETWPSSIPKFVQHLPITSNDVLFDLGSGTGRISFWFQKFSNCEVIAIEKVPLFVEKAQRIQKKLNAQKISFVEGDLLDIDYSKATLIYFYGTSFSDTFIRKLLEKWKSLRAGTRILTTSFYLNEYLEQKEYLVKKQYQVSYPWGTCELYLQEKL